MKKITLFLLLAFLAATAAAQEKPAGKDPDCVMLSIGIDPATSASVTWRTAPGDTASIAQIAPSALGLAIQKEYKTVQGTHAWWASDATYAMGHKIHFTGLKPATAYSYRVGNGTQWSEWFQFRTASDKVEPFSFIYLGDFQNDLRSMGSKAIRQAYSHFPDALFMLNTGDVVAVHDRKSWEEFFYAGGWIYGTMPTAVVPGNHEYSGGSLKKYSPQWDAIFALPDNAPTDKTRNRCWYIDCQGVRFIGLDGTAVGRDESDAIVEWFEKCLKTNPGKWCIVAVHQPTYSSAASRAGSKKHDRLKPLYEKYGVDLVLSGHDHVYQRGAKLDEVGKDCKNAPIYVVSVSGPKMYGLNPNLWGDRVASNTQFYQDIRFDGNVLSYLCYDISGELYDAFTLTKNPSGRNKFVEDPRVKNIPQKTDMPEGGENKYKPEDLEKYYKLFPKK